MKFFNRNKKKVYSSNIDIWMVSWTSRDGATSLDTRTCYKAFLDKEEASSFARDLENAYKMICNTGDNKVKMYKMDYEGEIH